MSEKDVNAVFRRKSFNNRNRNKRGRNGGRNDDIRKKDRIAKRLAILGVASRREAEKLVQDGKIKINGVECKDLTFLVSYEDTISLNGKEISNKPIKTQIYVMNKPAGYVTTNNDPQGRKTIFELIPSKFGRLISVGRLDFNTEGLLLLTNNGEVARILEMPATQLKRVYFARVIGKIDEKIEKSLLDLRNGINIEGVHYGKMIVEKQPNDGRNYTTLKIIIFEGKNNEIRRVMWHFGLRVVKLTRVSYGDFRLNGLPSGCVQESHVRLHIRDLERRASANMKAYNEGRRAGKMEINVKQKSKNDEIKEEDVDNKDLNEEKETFVDDITDDKEGKIVEQEIVNQEDKKEIQ